jgi:hypothetical protein
MRLRKSIQATVTLPVRISTPPVPLLLKFRILQYYTSPLCL